MTLKAHWIDSGREPQMPPNPRYPDGKHVNLVRDPKAAACFIELEYPARRCGVWIIECTLCGQNAAATTAGRRDDPRSVRMACKDQRRRK